MQLTPEQQAIIAADGNIKINAVAGSGKTSTLIAYAKSRPANSRILYLAFNKSVKLEAAKRFDAEGLSHVRVETAHSLAYRNIVFTNGYKVRSQGYSTSEVAQLLQLNALGEKHAEYIFANHVNRCAAMYCNSHQARVQELDYLTTINDRKAREFAEQHYQDIIRYTRVLLGMMDKGKTAVTHDFYLKKFQLSQPVLPYDYLLFDEGQDASPAMLDIFLRQQATRVIVGDTHQQIYSWRYAVNALEQVRFPAFELSTSFRFGDTIAKLAEEITSFKKHIGRYVPIRINGKGGNDKKRNHAIIARTNLGLLLKAIEYVTEEQKAKRIYFEGNFNSYIYADEGASLYDVLNLHNGKRSLIRDPLIAGMKTMDELTDYIEHTEDVQLGMMVEIVKEYGSEIPDILKEIKDKHVTDEEKHKAEVIFSTVHRCKGMEYDTVQLVNDFINEEKLKKLQEKPDESMTPERLNEEINLLYVAVTRTRHRLEIPDSLLPVNFPSSTAIRPLLTEKSISRASKEKFKKSAPKPVRKVYYAAGNENDYAAAYEPWTPALDAELTELFREGASLIRISAQLGRSKGAVWSRIKKLKLKEME